MSKLIKKNSFYKLNLSFILFFSFCSKKIETNTNVFRYNEYRNITSLDPAFSRNPQNIWPVNQIFNGLVQLDDSLNIIPEIAKSWIISDDGLEYTFILRDDVFFHKSDYFGKNKTRKVIASDFTFSLNRLKDKNLGSPGGWVLQNVKNYKSLNDSIFKIKLKNPFPAFLGLLSMKYCSVVPYEVVEALGESFSRNPIGTGPFYLKKWNENEKLVLRKIKTTLK
jgi:ABC-type dipeptide transport system, periplasmic component